MKATTVKETVMVPQEVENVSLSMTKDEAIFLYCMLGQSLPSEVIESVTIGIKFYNPQFSSLLPNIKERTTSFIFDTRRALEKVI